MSRAIITGASSGIGLELAKIFAEEGTDLILVARSKDKLQKLAKQLVKENKIKVKIVDLDLSKKDSAKKLFNTLKNERISYLVNNAGFGTFGEFKTLDIKREMQMLDLNVRTLVELCHYFLPEILKSKGRILNVASTAAFQPIPNMANYAATKSYVLSFSVALNKEISPSGASVTALCPGATKTNFHYEAEMPRKTAKIFESSLAMKAEDVAKEGYEAMMNRKAIIVTGTSNKIGAISTRLFSKSFAAKIASSIMNQK